MNTNWLPKGVLACSLTLTLIGCTSVAQRAQIEAGARMGIVAAGITIERQPDECSRDTPHAPLFAGQEVTTALSRERAQLDAANASKSRCYWFTENQRKGLSQ